MKTFRELMGFGFMPQIVFDTGGDSPGGGGGNDDNDTTPAATTPAVPEFDNYYDAIDAGYGGQEVSIGGQNVLAETADGYTGSGSTASDSYVDDTFGSGNIYTESTPGASTNNYGNTVSYDNDNDPPAPTPYNYVDTSNIAGISAASGVDYNPTANDDDNSLDPFGGAGSDISDDYVTNDGGISYTYDPIVSGGTGTSTGGTGGYDGSTYDEVPTYNYDDDDEDYTPTSAELNAAIDAAGGVNLTDSDYAADVDYTTTGSGADYASTATADDYDPPYVAPTPEPPAPPPVYYDAVGNPYGSQAEASAADAAAEQAAAQAAANMAAAFDEPTPAEIAAANAAAQREAYDDDEYTVMSQPVAPAAANVPSSADISYADILSGAGVSDEEIDSMRENILTGDTDFEPEPLDFSFLDETNELLSELGVAPIDVAALTKVGDSGINLEVANAPAALTEMAIGGDDAPITYDGDQAAGASGQIDDGRYDFVDDLPDDALDFVTTEKTDADRVNDLVAAGVDRTLAEAQIASGGEIGEPAGIDAYDFGFDGGLTGQPVGVGATEDDLATDFSAVPTGVGATDDDLATDFSTVSTETNKDLEFQNYLDGLVDKDFTDPDQTGLEAFETAQYDAGDFTDNNTVDDFMTGKTTSEIQAIEDAADIFQNEGAEALGDFRMDLGMSPIEPSVASDEAIARAEADMNALDILSEQTNVGTGATETSDIPTIEEINQTASTVTGQTGSELYLSAMDKVSDPSYDPNNSNLTTEEQYALYGARGRAPNAAETAYLNDLLSDARHKEDVINPDTGEVIAKAGDYVTDQSFMDQAGDVVVNLIDTFLNPFSIFGDQFTISGNNKARVEKQLEAYKNGGTFVYDENGSVVGVAEPNYDASGDGNNDTVVIFDEEGEIKVTGDGLDTDTIEISNEFSEEDDQIVIVESDSTYTNPEEVGGDVVVTTPTVEVDNDNDDNIPICEEGFEFDPVEGICMPIDEIGDGTRKIKFKPRPIRDNTPAPTPTPTPTPDVGGLIIRQPQFNRGGVVTRNIDKFANGGVVTPNIDNFLGGMRR